MRDFNKLPKKELLEKNEIHGNVYKIRLYRRWALDTKAVEKSYEGYTRYVCMEVGYHNPNFYSYKQVEKFDILQYENVGILFDIDFESFPSDIGEVKIGKTSDGYTVKIWRHKPTMLYYYLT